MAYCPKCGKQNADDAKFCAECGASFTGGRRDRSRECDEGCGEECSGGPNRPPVLWALLVILFGLWVVFEFGLKNIKGMPEWIHTFEFWWIFAVVIGLAIIISGLRMLAKRK